jgi:hypothetical protein
MDVCVCVCVSVCMCVCVCMGVFMCISGHNSGTPGAISTKLSTHIAIYICVCKNLMYVLYIFRREDGVGSREFG